MPSFNQARFLGDALRSILDQRYPKLELIVLDGGSTDGSLEILQSFAGSLAYWRSNRDGGQTDALIEGFSLATGELVGWVNSDDVLLPGALSWIAASHASHPRAAFFGGNYLLIDERGRVTKCKRHPRNAAWWAKFGIMAVNQPGSFFSAEAYSSVGGLRRELHYVMDTDLYIRMLTSGIRYVHVGAWLAGFRVHASAKTTAHRDSKEREHLFARGAYRARSEKTNLSGKVGLLAWRHLFRTWQLINGNYALMAAETLRARGQHWRQWATTHCIGLS